MPRGKNLHLHHSVYSRLRLSSDTKSTVLNSRLLTNPTARSSRNKSKCKVIELKSSLVFTDSLNIQPNFTLLFWQCELSIFIYSLSCDPDATGLRSRPRIKYFFKMQLSAPRRRFQMTENGPHSEIQEPFNVTIPHVYMVFFTTLSLWLFCQLVGLACS